MTIQQIELPGDSSDYHLLTKGVELSKGVNGLTCELGVRRGGGTKIIMDAMHLFCPGKVHVAVDPYGHIEYEHKEAQTIRLDYTNQMRNQCMANLFSYADIINETVLFFNLEDTEFFEKFDKGVPIYDLVKYIVNEYSFVHFDAAHAHDPLITEIDFFAPRTPKGGCWVFDDVVGYYDHDKVEVYILSKGFTLIEKTQHKALYAKN